ncbi:MAG: hypothetical protein FJ335_08150 [Sphingomonadales bacterium]|nr:hypothetical protein [Sphingomonadales bacterium]
MLSQHAPFPYAGSTALYGDRQVRIIRVEADGRRLITGNGKPQLCKTVDISELTDAAIPADPVKAWFDDRVVSGTAFTSVVDLHDDFAAYSARRGIARADILAPIVFGRRLHALTGTVAVRRRLPQSIAATRCLPLSLRTLANAA